MSRPAGRSESMLRIQEIARSRDVEDARERQVALFREAFPKRSPFRAIPSVLRYPFLEGRHSKFSRTPRYRRLRRYIFFAELMDVWDPLCRSPPRRQGIRREQQNRSRCAYQSWHILIGLPTENAEGRQSTRGPTRRGECAVHERASPPSWCREHSRREPFAWSSSSSVVACASTPPHHGAIAKAPTSPAAVVNAPQPQCPRSGLAAQRPRLQSDPRRRDFDP